MSKKTKISKIKQVKIRSSNFLKDSFQGKYFLIKNKDSVNYLSTLRIAIAPELYHDTIVEIEKLPYNLTHLLNAKEKRKIKELDSKTLMFVNFESEFSWAKNIIIRNSSEINKFIELSQEYSKSLIASKYPEARSILQQIEDQYGHSIWLIKNKIALLQISEGLESQKKYSQSIKQELGFGGLIKFIVHWLSVRNEDQTSIGRFSSQIESIINKFHPIKQIGYKDYCLYHLLATETTNPEDFIQILNIEYSCSIIDYYEAFVSLLRILSLSESEKDKMKVVTVLKNDKFLIKDSRLDFLSIILDVENRNNINSTDEDLIEPYNLYLKGNYEDSLKMIMGKLEKSPDNPILLMIYSYVKSMFNAETKTKINKQELTNGILRDLILNDLSNIVDKGLITSVKEYNELNKISINFSSFPWASAIKIIMNQENLIFQDSNKELALLTLKIPYFHLSLNSYLKNYPSLCAYEKLCLDHQTDKTAINYFISLGKNDDQTIPNNLSEDHSNFIKALINFNKGKLKDAILYADKLIKSKTDHFIRRGYGIITRAYMNLNDFENACLTASDCYIHYRSFYPFLPLQELLGVIRPGSEAWKRVNSLIDLSIILDAYVKNIDKKLVNERRFAYEDFLLKHGINKPSQLSTILSNFDKQKIIYYLRYVCIETTMETSGSFEGGSQEVVEERLAICKLLVDIDITNADVHKQEIKDLVRRQVITSRRQEVDQSRIYVDIQSIKEWAESELKENFDRYIAYIKIGFNTLSNEENGHRRQKSDQLSAGIDIPENETSDLLRFMIEEIRDAYLSPEIGLDRFISTRIRHGDLERNMRSPIQKHNLITKKEFKNGPYLHNDFWLNKLRIESLPLLKRFDQAFLTFSESYDNLIFTITNDWLQIKKQSKPNGLFDFTFSDEDTNMIAAKITENTSLKEFIDLVIVALESTLILRLFNIRDELNNKAKAEAKKLLNDLQEATRFNLNSASLELQSAISQARTDLQTQFEKIIEWFVPSSEGSSAPYFIDDAMMVAEAIIKEANPSFKVNIDADEESEVAIHGHLPIFVDIFINIFENVVRRSGLEPPAANIKIWTESYNPELKRIYFKVLNELGTNIDLNLLDAELKRKMNLLTTVPYSEYLATEGNSGFFKIHKSIMDCCPIGFDAKPTMDFGLENNAFHITISVPFRIFHLDLDKEI